MQMIIAEKSTAAETIAKNLSESRISSKEYGPVKVWITKINGEESVVIPLKGHIKEVKYPSKYKKWSYDTLKEMIYSKLDYADTAIDNIDVLKDYAKKAEKVIIATDYDTEGESIGFEAIDVVRSVNSRIKIYRAVFSSLTKSELSESFSNLKEPNKNLADSADARREIDLILGAVLTRFISLSARRLGNSYLSVGRVQTPTLTFIVDREQERRDFKPQKFWSFTARLDFEGNEMLANYKEEKIFDPKEAEKIRAVKKAKEARIVSISKKLRSVLPPKPFDTTTFLRSAASAGFSIMNAMRIVQGLYMKGYVSYPRTDNQSYPPTLNLKEILNELGKDRRYKQFTDKVLSAELHPTSGKTAKDHPPIHPVKLPDEKLTPQEFKIFDLISRRFLATFMDPSKEESMLVTLDINGKEFELHGAKVLEPGWRSAYIYSKYEENILPPKLKEGQILRVKSIDEEEAETAPPPRYSQGGMIKLMEEYRLGTKSTRPEILSKLMLRRYISASKTLIPSEVAFAVTQSLKKISPELTGPKLTADLEEEMNNITEAKKSKEEVVDEARKDVSEILSDLEKKKKEVGELMHKALLQQYVFGKCPLCGHDLKMIISKRTHKRFVGCSNYPNCHFAMPLPQSGYIFISPQTCPKCGLHEIEWRGKESKRTYIFCVNPACHTEADKEKTKEPAKAKEK
ncbi:MAG: DNA topoisomerase I [Candidatus Parvarchaeota archaeon]